MTDKPIKFYNKAVRDFVPRFLEKQGIRHEAIQLSDDIFLKTLYAKMYEENGEFQEKHDLMELVDLVEVIHRILDMRGWDWETLEKYRMEKKAKSGGFDYNRYLVYAEEKGYETR